MKIPNKATYKGVTYRRLQPGEKLTRYGLERYMAEATLEPLGWRRHEVEGKTTEELAATHPLLVFYNPECLGFTHEQFKAFDSACHATYQAIGCDLPGPNMKQRELIEVILDADYIRMYGGPFIGKYKDAVRTWEKDYSEIIRPWISKNYGDKRFWALMRLIFPYNNYETGTY